MDVFQESVSEFIVGHGGADAASKPIVTEPYSRKAYKGVNVRAATANTINIYVGPQGVTVETDSASLLAKRSTSRLTIRARCTSLPPLLAIRSRLSRSLAWERADTFTLTFDGETTNDIADDATAATVKTELEGLANIGAGNVDVTGNAGGPYTVEFKGTLAKQDVSLITGVATTGTVTVTKTDASAGSQYSWISR